MSRLRRKACGCCNGPLVANATIQGHVCPVCDPRVGSGCPVCHNRWVNIWPGRGTHADVEPPRRAADPPRRMTRDERAALRRLDAALEWEDE